MGVGVDVCASVFVKGSLSVMCNKRKTLRIKTAKSREKIDLMLNEPEFIHLSIIS